MVVLSRYATAWRCSDWDGSTVSVSDQSAAWSYLSLLSVLQSVFHMVSAKIWTPPRSLEGDLSNLSMSPVEFRRL